MLLGIFSSIKSAIFGKKQAKAAAPATQKTSGPTAAPATTSAQPTGISEIDVAARLDAMPGSDKLNWRTSIVDLMKLIGVDASYENRKELAEELGNSSYSGSAEDNIKLHRQTMQELAKNGGKVPAEFLN